MTRLIQVVFMSSLLAVAGGAWACESAGHNKHVGEVTKVDTMAGTFTIHDVGMDGPITFTADQAVLKTASQAKGQVLVSFEKKGEKLKAVGLAI